MQSDKAAVLFLCPWCKDSAATNGGPHGSEGVDHENKKKGQYEGGWLQVKYSIYKPLPQKGLWAKGRVCLRPNMAVALGMVFVPLSPTVPAVPANNTIHE